MRRRGSGGRVINMGSIMGTASLQGAPDYCAAKGAILAFTNWVRDNNPHAAAAPLQVQHFVVSDDGPVV